MRYAFGPAGRWLVICLALLFVFQRLASAETTVSVGTLNCEFLIESRVHAKYGLDLDPNRWTDEQRMLWEKPGYRAERFAESVAAVAQAIKPMNPDILGLTEVGTLEDVQALRTQLRRIGVEYPFVAVAQSTDTFTGQNVAVLSRLPLRDIGRQIPGREFYDTELDDPEAESSTGISKGMHVTVEVEGRRLWIYLVHLSSERGGHEQDMQRIAQASVVRRNYLPHLKRGDHVLVLGDLNDHRGQPTLRRLRGRDDIEEDLLQTAGPTFYRQQENETPQQYNERLNSHWTYEYAGQRQQIDHVLISGSIYERCGSGGIGTEFFPITATIASTGQPATDHRGLVVTFRFR